MGTKFEGHIIIVGWDRFGQNVCEQIIGSDHRVAVVTDRKEDVDLIYSIYPKEYVFVLFSSLENCENLEKINVRKCAKIFINLNDDTKQLVYVLNLKRSFPDVNVVVSLNNSKLKETFSSAGVTYAVSKDSVISKLVASYIFEPDVAEITEEIMAVADGEDDYDLQEYRISKDNSFVGQDCLKIFMDLKIEYNCILMGLSQKREDGTWNVIRNPGKETIVRSNDYMIILANGKTKEQIQTSFGVVEGRLE